MKTRNLVSTLQKKTNPNEEVAVSLNNQVYSIENVILTEDNTKILVVKEYKEDEEVVAENTTTEIPLVETTPIEEEGNIENHEIEAE